MSVSKYNEDFFGRDGNGEEKKGNKERLKEESSRLHPWYELPRRCYFMEGVRPKLDLAA
jgi:hypothetical protein